MTRLTGIIIACLVQILCLSCIVSARAVRSTNNNTCTPVTDHPVLNHNSTFGILPFEISTASDVSPDVQCTDDFRNRQINHSDPLHYHGPCPYAYRMNYNSSRIPNALPEAYCICPQCRHRDDRDCQLVKVSMKVLMRSAEPCVDGMYKFELTDIDWPVACACAHHQLSPQSWTKWSETTFLGTNFDWNTKKTAIYRSSISRSSRFRSKLRV